MVRQKIRTGSKKIDGGIRLLRDYIQEKNEFLNFKNKKFILVILIIVVIISIMPRKDNASDNSDEEKKLQNILSEIDGVGEVSVMITYYSDDNRRKDSSEAKGAVIICDGADNAHLRSEVSDAAMAALNLPAHRVKVFKKCK